MVPVAVVVMVGLLQTVPKVRQPSDFGNTKANHGEWTASGHENRHIDE